MKTEYLMDEFLLWTKQRQELRENIIFFKLLLIKHKGDNEKAKNIREIIHSLSCIFMSE